MDTIQDPQDNIYNHLELLSQMSKDFASSINIQATLRHALTLITEYIGAEGGALFLLDEEGKILTCSACVGDNSIEGVTFPSQEGIVGRCLKNNTSEIVADVRNDKNFYARIDNQSGYSTRSILCAPLSVKNVRIGAIELTNKIGDDGLFEDGDLNLLTTMSAAAAFAILNARMSEALVEQEVLKSELELAAEIQRSLLPMSSKRLGIYGVNVPARVVSGDFYDFFELEDGRIVFNIGDVSGKGMNSALLMAKTASIFHCLGKTIHQPGDLLRRVNQEVCETVTRGMFVTMVAGLYDPRSGNICISNAGHEAPLFLDEDNNFVSIPATSPPLGIVPDTAGDNSFEETNFNLGNGSLCLFTDGVTEGFQRDGSDYTVAGLKATLLDKSDLPPLSRLAAIVKSVYRGKGRLRDDITLVLVQPGQ